jgi:hypothetical protein
MTNIDPTSARVADPLSEVTRANRKWLLFSSLLGVLFVQAGLVPTRLSLLGTEFKQWEDKNLILVLICVSAFYLVSFVVAAVSDYFSLRMKIFTADTDDDATYELLLQREADDELTEQDKILLFRLRTHAWIFNTSNWVSKLRLIVEFILPTIFSIYSITIMSIYVLGK